MIDDAFYSSLGCKLIEILEYCEMVNKVLVRVHYKNQHPKLGISDQSLMYKVASYKVFTVSANLPRIVKPKPYSMVHNGGYLLNDVD